MSTRFPPVDRMCVIDVGNTNVAFAIWDDDGLHGTRRLPVDRPEAWTAPLREIWEHVSKGSRNTVVMSSVNAPAATRVAQRVEETCDREPLLVRDDLPLPMPVDVENVEQVGVDRICSAAAAFDRVQDICAVASFGTATTIDCVSRDGRFLGGAILPGIAMSYDVLHQRTAALPDVQPGAPLGAFGRNTEQAITNGVTFGAVGALREIVERFATELNQWPLLVITGGGAALISQWADFVDAAVPDLCLMGVALTYRKAAGQI